MPELPEVHTTVTGLNTVLPGLVISDIWTDYDSPYFYNKDHIKDPKYFLHFKKSIKGKKIVAVSRRAKNILIHLENSLTILIHMKMTGHLMYGSYKKTTPKDRTGVWKKETWIATVPGPLTDPFNRFIHLVFSLSNGKHLILSDMRKFAKVTLIAGSHHEHKEISSLGKEPLENIHTWKEFKADLSQKPHLKMKQVLLDQSLIAGIGNIYSDEILWEANISPIRSAQSITDSEWKKLFNATQKILKDSIAHGGDSMSDYRNAFGEKGNYQNFHKAYRQTHKPCPKPKCSGTIKKIVLGGRSTHYCNTHQK